MKKLLNICTEYLILIISDIKSSFKKLNEQDQKFRNYFKRMLSAFEYCVGSWLFVGLLCIPLVFSIEILDFIFQGIILYAVMPVTAWISIYFLIVFLRFLFYWVKISRGIPIKGEKNTNVKKIIINKKKKLVK